MTLLPSFIIIGAMKSATTTLYEQLSAQSGIFMPELKEPNYFSDDEQFSRGISWYSSLFDIALDSELLGEASTHYTKLPTYPQTIQRLSEQIESPKLIYVMRHPVDRLISQYIHEWTQGNINVCIDEAINKYNKLIDYSRYAYQLSPYIDKYGKENILPVFFENIKSRPQLELERICKFIGYSQKPVWNHNLSPSNVSKDRIRKFPLYDLLVETELARMLRRAIVPKAVRNILKVNFQMNERPDLSIESYNILETEFNKDLSKFNNWFGFDFNCANFEKLVTQHNITWKHI